MGTGCSNVDCGCAIVVECTVLSPGVLNELGMIVDMQRAERTVVVLPSANIIKRPLGCKGHRCNRAVCHSRGRGAAEL
jgi:hypothetical protein